MNAPQRLLFNLVNEALAERVLDREHLQELFKKLSPEEGAWVFVTGLLLEAALPTEKAILLPADFLPSEFYQLSGHKARAFKKCLTQFKTRIVGELIRSHEDYYREFTAHAVHIMAEYVGRLTVKIGSDEVVGGWDFDDVLYRAFDDMDRIFELRYELDRGMAAKIENQERLYEGAGVGVQTSYATILAALACLRLRSGAHLVDLGSGYGRVGLVAGLWREDLLFTGYEYVGHRVGVANASALRAGLSARVQFLEQDLGKDNFRMPRADVYYLYDPFCEETYRRVLRQIIEIGRVEAIAVVAKGNARIWMERAVASEGWLVPEVCDLGTLKVFRSNQLIVSA